VAHDREHVVTSLSRTRQTSFTFIIEAIAIKGMFDIIILYMARVEGDRRGDGVAVPLYFDDIPSWSRAVTEVFPWAGKHASAAPSEHPHLFSKLPSDLSNILSNATSRGEDSEPGEEDAYLGHLGSESRGILDRGIANLNMWRSMIDALGWDKTSSKLVFEKMIDRIIHQDLVPDIVQLGIGTRDETFRAAVIYSNPIESTAFQLNIATPLLLNGFDILHQVQIPPKLYQGSSRGGPSIQAVFTHELPVIE